MFRAHEVHPDDDTDWTKVKDWTQESWLREERNEMIKEQLLKGCSVQYRSSGSSLQPRVYSGDCCLFEPITDHDSLKKDDIVFCRVQPSDLYYAHKIFRIESLDSDEWDWTYTAESAPQMEHGGKRRFIISSNRTPPRINGFCRDHHIYGRLIEVME